MLQYPMEFWKLLLQWSSPDPSREGLGWRHPVHCLVVSAQVIWDALFAFVTEEALIRASSPAFTSVVTAKAQPLCRSGKPQAATGRVAK